MKRFTLQLIFLLTVPFFISAQTARLQAIHNSADAAAAEVDVYLNGALLIDNFAFRTASPFIDAPAGTNIALAIAPSSSSSAADAIAVFNYNLTPDETYVLVASGIVSPSGYSPATPFDIAVYPMGREAAANPANTDILVYHGATDAPAVDVYETAVPAGRGIDNLIYGQFTGYAEVGTGDYRLEVRDASGSVGVASFEAPLATLGLQGQALVAVASGFLNPAINSNGAAFGLWVALPAGGQLVELPVSTTRVQVIHNSADAAVADVDVYLGNELLLDNFTFRSATPYVDLPAGKNITISLAPASSTDVSESIASFDYKLDAKTSYVIVANGIVSGSGYIPATPFDLYVYPMAKETAKRSNKTDILVFHGSTDAPTVDLYESSIPAGTIVDDIAYGSFSDGYASALTRDYTLDVRDETGASTVVSYSAPLQSLALENQALVAVASGFLNPAQNSNGAAFGIWVALPTGGGLVELPVAGASKTAPVAQIKADEINFYPNPVVGFGTLNLSQFEGEQVDIAIFSADGQLVSNSSTDAQELEMDLSNLSSGMYQLVVSGKGKSYNKSIVVN